MERQEMGRLLAAVAAPLAERQVPPTSEDRRSFAQTLLPLSQILDQHIACFDG
jgi:hypothetical protein